MKKIIGVLLVITGIITAALGGFGLLIYGVWDIFTNFSSMGFGDFLFAVLLMLGRDLIAFAVAFAFAFFGLALLND
jgi:hypothetical protein